MFQHNHNTTTTNITNISTLLYFIIHIDCYLENTLVMMDNVVAQLLEPLLVVRRG